MRIKKMQHKAVAIANQVEASHQQTIAKNLFDHSALVDLMSEVIKNAAAIGMRDIPKLLVTKIRIGSLVKTIENSATSIRKEITKVVALTEESKDFMDNEHSYEVYRLVKNMAFMSTEDLSKFNDGVEKERSNNVN